MSKICWQGSGMPQYSKRQILAIWVAAAVPMGLMAWCIAPHFSHGGTDPVSFAKWLIGGLTAGLVWQGILVLGLVWRERGDLRWTTLKQALWLHAPSEPHTGKKNHWIWLICLPLSAGFWLAASIPEIAHDPYRDFGFFLQSEAGQSFFAGNWVWYGIVIVMLLFNTVLGEELLFRGLLLPRMNGAFGQLDWLVNGVMFACYHLHTPWVIPAAVLDALWLAAPSKRYRSAWIGIAIHSTPSVLILILLFPLVFV